MLSLDKMSAAAVSDRTGDFSADPGIVESLGKGGAE